MRALYSDNGSLIDVTASLENYNSGALTMSYVTGEDYLYLGNDYPFNHFYLKMGTPVNAIAANMNIEYWGPNGWVNTVETIDQTGGLFTSGFVDFTPSKLYNWTCKDTTEITGLTSVTIYDLYWIRVSFNFTLTPSILINWVGNLFSNDDDLYSEYPLFNRSVLLNYFINGKTNWEEQHVKAAEVLVKDLKSEGHIVDPGQIMSRKDYRLASVAKTAQIIFTPMGDDYSDQLETATKDYWQRLNVGVHKVDNNKTAILDKDEKKYRDVGIASVGIVRR